MFNNFPKRRPVLPEAYQAIYTEHYKSNREGQTTATSISQKLENWLHKKVAADMNRHQNKSTLEIGAGTLNQLQYENIEHYDIIEPFKELYENSPLLDKINNVYSDISEIDRKNRYDRITSVATFEHVTNLPEVVANSCLLLKKGGVLRTAIPSEGGLLWKMAYTLTTGIEFKLKHGLDYEVLMRHEHVNSAKEIQEILKYFFGSNTTSYFGFGPNLSFYQFIESKHPKMSVANKFMDDKEFSQRKKSRNPIYKKERARRPA